MITVNNWEIPQKLDPYNPSGRGWAERVEDFMKKYATVINSATGKFTVSATSPSSDFFQIIGSDGTVVAVFDTSANSFRLTGTSASKVMVTDANGNIKTSPVASSQLTYLSGVTSDIQIQINNKADTASLSAYALASTSANYLTSAVLSGYIPQSTSATFALASTSANYIQVSTSGQFATSGHIHSVATSAVNGFLLSSDWTTFNSKASTSSLSAYIPQSTSATFATSASLSAYALASTSANYLTSAVLSAYIPQSTSGTFALASTSANYIPQSTSAVFALASTSANYIPVSTSGQFATSASLSSYALSASLSAYASTASLSAYIPQSTSATFALASTSANYATSAMLSAYQPIDDALTALATISGTTGLVTMLSTTSATTRTLSAGSSKVTITNADGVVGNPTIDVVTSAIVGYISASNVIYTKTNAISATSFSAVSNVQSAVDRVVTERHQILYVKTSTSASIALTSATTSAVGNTDGIIVTQDDLVLVRSQAGNIGNGVYVVQSSGTWSKDYRYDTEKNVRVTDIYVENGNTFKGTWWTCALSGGNIVSGAAVSATPFSQIPAGIGTSAHTAAAGNHAHTGTYIAAGGAAPMIPRSVTTSTIAVSHIANFLSGTGTIVIGTSAATISAAINSTNPEKLVISADSATSVTMVGIKTSANAYRQVLIQNFAAGTSASTDLVINNDAGTETSNYVDLGINSTAFTDPAYSAMGPGDAYLYNQNADLVIGVASATKAMSVIAGGTTSDKVVGLFDENGYSTQNDKNIVLSGNSKLYVNGTQFGTRNLGDVSAVAPSNGQALVWNSANSVYIPNVILTSASLTPYALASTSANYIPVSTSGQFATSASLSSYALSASLSAYALASTSANYIQQSTSAVFALASTSANYIPVSTSGQFATSASLSSYALSASLSAYALASTSANYIPQTSSATFALASTSANYIPQSTSAVFALASTSANYIPQTTSGTFATSASLSAYALASTSANYIQQSTSAVFALASTSANYIPQSTSATFALASTSANYIQVSTSGQFATSASLSAYIPQSTSATFALASTSANYIQVSTSGQFSLSGHTHAVATSAANGFLLSADWSAFNNGGTFSVSAHMNHGWPLDVNGDEYVNLNYISSTRTFTVSAKPGNSTFDVWVKGQKFTSATASIQHAATSATGYFIYFTSAGALSADSTFWNLREVSPTAYVYYSSAVGAVSGVDGILVNELHNWKRDPEWHKNHHLTDGTKTYGSGFTISNYATTTDTDNSKKFIIATGNVADEDIFITTSASTSGSYTVLYLRSGTDWIWEKQLSLPALLSAGQTSAQALGVYYVTSGGTKTMIAPINGNNQYVNYYVFVTTSETSAFQYILIPGQTVYTSLANAQAESWTSLAYGNIPLQEFAPLYQLTYVVKQTGGGGTNYPNSTGHFGLAAAPVRIVGSVANITGATTSTVYATNVVVSPTINSNGNVQASLTSLDSGSLSVLPAQTSGGVLFNNNGTISASNNVILSANNLGIGKIPDGTATFDVSGNVSVATNVNGQVFNTFSNNSTSASAEVWVGSQADLSSIRMISWSSNRSGTFLGINKTGRSCLNTSNDMLIGTSSGIYLGTTSTSDVVVLTNNIERMRFTSAGVIQAKSLSGTSVPRLVMADTAGNLSVSAVYVSNVLSSAGSTSAITWDASLYDSMTCDLSGVSTNSTITISNLAVGGKYQLLVKQHLTAAKTLALSATGYTIKTPGAAGYAISTTLSAVDLLSMTVMRPNELLVVINKAFA